MIILKTKHLSLFLVISDNFQIRCKSADKSLNSWMLPSKQYSQESMQTLYKCVNKCEVIDDWQKIYHHLLILCFAEVKPENGFNFYYFNNLKYFLFYKTILLIRAVIKWANGRTFCSTQLFPSKTPSYLVYLIINLNLNINQSRSLHLDWL